LLSAPYNLIAQSHGLTELVKAHAVIGPYQGNVAAAKRSWIEAHPSKAEAYVRGYRKAIDWLYQPANKSEAIKVLRRNLPDMSVEVAEGSYRELLDPRHGFFRDCRIDLDGLKCVLELRSRWAVPSVRLVDPSKYCELMFH
jgi:ABC-type nitrate/sulfonate/bicarbonate transport system substrate-binding protein